MQAPVHLSRVLRTPWPSVHATQIESGRHFARHWHATYGLGLVDAGAQRSASGRGTVEAFAGDLLATNPGEVHDGQPLGGPSRRWRIVYLEPEVLAGVRGDARDGEVALERAAFHDPALRRALQQLLDRLQLWEAQPHSSAALACEEALTRTCALLLARHATAPPQRADEGGDLARVRERLAESVLETPSLQTLAAIAGLGKYQLLRRFAKTYGLTPHAWLLQLRAERARGLIGRGAPLAEAAAASGFADQSHMTRVFARQFGFTPGAWRRSAASDR
ncbi:MAG: AraC family transcriptional regulator [Comamonadaceae bacterium]|nr:MAG: AraC family transcriptional regulator [Comamonadaceae bacterium]